MQQQTEVLITQDDVIQSAFRPARQQHLKLNRYVQRVDELTQRVNFSHQSAMIRNKEIAVKKERLESANRALSRYKQKQNALYQHLLKINGISSIQAQIQRFKSHQTFMKNKHDELVLLAQQNNIRQNSIRQDLLSLKERLKRIMKQNFSFSAEKLLAPRSQSSSLSKLSLIQRQESTPKVLLTDRTRQSSLKKNKSDFKSKIPPESKFDLIKPNNPIKYSSRVHPLLDECLKLGFKQIKDMNNQNEISQGIALEVMRNNKQRKQIPPSQVSQMVYGVLRTMVEKQKQFVVEWQSFKEFNGRQILGLAALKGVEKVMSAVRSI